MILFIFLAALAVFWILPHWEPDPTTSDRPYRSGTGWCVWRWTVTDSEYILRLHVLKTRWFAVCLHWLRKPDPEPWLHDHPVSFLSIILRGWYEETRLRQVNSQRIKHSERLCHCYFNFIRATPDDRHTITEVAPGRGALTLCFMGPKKREWGFHTDKGWVYWKTYHHARRAEKQ